MGGGDRAAPWFGAQFTEVLGSNLGVLEWPRIQNQRSFDFGTEIRGIILENEKKNVSLFSKSNFKNCQKFFIPSFTTHKYFFLLKIKINNILLNLVFFFGGLIFLLNYNHKTSVSPRVDRNNLQFFL